jgi:hypothetical protein
MDTFHEDFLALLDELPETFEDAEDLDPPEQLKIARGLVDSLSDALAAVEAAQAPAKVYETYPLSPALVEELCELQDELGPEFGKSRDGVGLMKLGAWLEGKIPFLKGKAYRVHFDVNNVYASAVEVNDEDVEWPAVGDRYRAVGEITNDSRCPELLRTEFKGNADVAKHQRLCAEILGTPLDTRMVKTVIGSRAFLLGLQPGVDVD